MDIRRRMVKAVDGGASRNAVAKRFEVAASTVIKLMKHVEATGGLAPKQMGGYRKPKLAAHDGLVRDIVRATPDATLDEIVAELKSHGVVVGRSSLNRYLGKIGWSFKKNTSRIRARQARRQGGA